MVWSIFSNGKKKQMFCAGGTEAEKNGGRRCVGGVGGVGV